MEYMEVLNKIIAAERLAQQIAGEARAQRDNLPNDLRAHCEELRESFLVRAEHRVQAVRDQEAAATAQSLEQLDKALGAELSRLEAFFTERHEDMVNRLFSLVVGV
jgi:vacuolar-type H+-ATPase subunit H